jgi:hypothetical protein
MHNILFFPDAAKQLPEFLFNTRRGLKFPVDRPKEFDKSDRDRNFDPT